MSSENGDIDGYHLGCYQSQSSSHHHHNTQNSQTARRRSSYGQSHFSGQLTAQPIIFKDSCSLVGSQDNLGCSSPSRYDCYVPAQGSGGRPTRYEETITCCMPPPSPAPANDRFVIGMPGPQHRLMVQQASQQRTMSPNSRYRSSYRDMPGHYLASATPLSSNDNYTTYLSSTVHTPVKRYIPTPPPCTNDHQSSYSDASTLSNPGYHLSLPPTHHQSALTQIGSSQTLKPQKSSTRLHHQHPNQQQQQQQQTNSQYRIKCCSSDKQQQQQISNATLPLPSSSHTDHYATTPRIRPNNLQKNSGSQQQPTCCQQASQAAVVQCDYGRISGNVDYASSNSGASRVVTPINLINSQTDQSCLNCRRTTGVHQTTQTTGPISPIPQQTLTLSDSHSTQSPLSPQPSSNHSIASASLEQTYSSIAAIQKQQQQQQTDNAIEEEVSIQPPQILINKSAPQAAASSAIIEQQQQQQIPQVQSQQPESSITGSNRSFMFQYQHNDSSSNLLNSTASNNSNNQRNISTTTLQQQRQQNQSRYSRKQKIKDYVKREIAKFFGVDMLSEEEERIKWFERQKRLAIRCFGQLRDDMDISSSPSRNGQGRNEQLGYRPDILPVTNNEESERTHYKIERKASVATMMWNGMTYMVSRRNPRKHKQWSRSFAPAQVKNNDDNDLCDGLSPIANDEAFFDSPATAGSSSQEGNASSRAGLYSSASTSVRTNGWQFRSNQHEHELQNGMRPGYRISSHVLDGIMDNSRRPLTNEIKLMRPSDLDDRHDYRPFFTYWVNTVHILVLAITLICYGIVAFGIGMEQKTGQVMVTNLNLQQVSHQEQRNVWIGPRSMDLVHLGAKFGGCMRRDARVLDVIAKTKRKERETACCIRNDDSGCVQTSQAECSVGGLWPTQKTISTWKKWSPGESGPGGRISGSVCGLDPKFCDAPQSFEWPDDITKWPICRKTNSFSHRSRMKDHTAEHMVCEIIGHPCCYGVYGECRITTKEYCDFVNGYFHEEASLCSQVSCMGNVCGMFPFFSHDVPDQFYRLFTSLCLHAGILHLAITIAFQHIFLSDLERLLGPLRTAIIYISSGIAGNLTSAILVPYRPEVGPLASLAGVVSSLAIILTFCHWKQLKKPYLALIKLLLIGASLFGMSTLPWQANFAGLIGGIVIGIVLTFALVPFVNITKYNRKSKINLIWTCIILQLLIYTAMFIFFYVFPSLFTSIGFIGGIHPVDHFGHYESDHSSSNSNQNVFNNVIGGIVSSIRNAPESQFSIEHKPTY